MIHQGFRPSERRQNLRLAIDHRSDLRLTLDGSPAGSEVIQGVTITDISQDGLMAAGAGQLVPGATLTLEVPLVGWREAQVIWIADNRAGCRFVQPLTLDELALAATHSNRLAAECPSLIAQIAEVAAGSESDVTEEHMAWHGPDRPLPRLRWWLVPTGVVALMVLGFVLALVLFELLD